MDRTLLKRFFENLFGTVIDHVGPDCTVVIEGFPDEFSVAVDEPMPAAVHEQVMTGDFSTQGTGNVELAIVAAHDGELTVTDAETGGVRVSVSGIDVVA